MATKLPAKDVAIIGLGWTGAILANELADQGLDVVAIERGPWRDTATSFNIGYAPDELRYGVRLDLCQQTALGHCGACHTPKTVMGAEEQSAYLQGGKLNGWYAPNITADPHKGIGSWPVEEIVAYLKTGANRDALASGGMGEEVVHSSSHMTDDDLHAIALYLLSLKPDAHPSPRALAATDPRMTAGQAIYKDNCAGCHTDGGSGAPRLFPRLAGSPQVQSDDPSTLIRTVLFGSKATATAGAPTGPAMPNFAWRLGDAQAAAVVTYIRNAWGNAAAPVSPHQVQTIRGGENAP